VNEQRKNKFTWLIFQRAPANLSPAGAHNAEAQRGTNFVCCSTQGQTKQAAAYMLVGRPPSLAGNEIFTRERATCSAREKLMPSQQTSRGEAGARRAQAAKVHSFRTPIRRARLNKLISTAGREGRVGGERKWANFSPSSPGEKAKNLPADF
jgi:hypothetical protein